MVPRDPVACAAFLLVAFVLAGAAQTAWLAARASRALSIPLDAGLTWRGRRLLGANKTMRGFVVMVPAAAASFALLAWLVDAPALGLWPLTVAEYAALGLLAGVGFMAGELPNSFIKRQLDIEPGDAAAGPLAAGCQLIADRVDSGIGMLAAISLRVPTPWTTWAFVLLVGPFIHWSFSFALFRLGVKRRAA